MVTLLKLGGSVITEKDEPETVDEAALETAVSTISEVLADPETALAPGGLVLVHGGGSFGHHRAAAHGVTESTGTTDAGAIADVHEGMGILNEAVVSRAQAAGIPALPMRPLSMSRRGEDGLMLATGQVDAFLAEGFVPVLHGDVVLDAGSGATILSGDELVVALARTLPATRVGLCSGVPGVLDASGDVVSSIERFEEVAGVLDASEATDVTGGMAGKVRKLLDLEASASIFGLDELQSFLRTGTAGTTIP